MTSPRITARSLRLIALACAAVLLPAAEAWACPNCKFALEVDGSNEPQAYMASIVFMLGTIMSLFGSMTGMLCWLSRRERQSLIDAGYEHVLENGVTESAAGKSDGQRPPLT